MEYAGREDLFEGLAIWEEEKYRKLQGTYPVVYLSFASIKETKYELMRAKVCEVITNLYSKYYFLRDSDALTDKDREYFDRVSLDMNEAVASSALHQLCSYLSRYYGKKVLVLLDEYDTLMQEGYVNGSSREGNEPSDCLQAFGDCPRAHGSKNHEREEMVSFTRSLFNSTFKTNPYLERAVMTGITRVSKESIFSDFNNPKVVTTTSNEYATAFGFTEKELFCALEECGCGEKKDDIKRWYDGFIFGKQKDIYNPWSIINFLDTGQLGTYWANTSSNSLVGKLIREGREDLKKAFEDLLKGKSIYCRIDEQIVYNQLDNNEDAIFSLLLASEYLKVLAYEQVDQIAENEEPLYELELTNHEVKHMFFSMVRGWFDRAKSDYNNFVKALLKGDLKAMNAYMNRVALTTFSYFDTGRCPSFSEPERFYHGFVLGLIADLSGEYVITSNRESGFGRYDVVIEPKDPGKNDAIILEFKVHDEEDEASLKETVQSALTQIEAKHYEANLTARGIPSSRIRKYGFAFEGKKVLIG